MKKRTIGWILALVLLVSFSLSAISAAESEPPAFEIYLAEYYLNTFPYQYYTEEFSTPYRAAVEQKDSSVFYQSSLNAWALLTFELQDLADSSKKKAGFYEALLFDLLYEGQTMDSLSGILKKITDSAHASVNKKVTNLFGSSVLSSIDPKALSDDELLSLIDTLKTCEELVDVFDAIDDIGKLLEFCTNVEELIYKLCMIHGIGKLSGDMVLLLTDLKTSTADQDMQTALTDMIALCSANMSDEMVNTIFLSEGGIEIAAEIALEQVWDGLLGTLGLAGIAVEAGQAMGKTASNWLFSTDREIELYYTMHVLYRFEDSLKAVLKSYETAYRGSPTLTNAKKFNNALEMLMKVHLLGIRCCKQYNDLLYKDGAVNQLLFWFRQDKYNEYADCLSSIELNVNAILYHAQNEIYNQYLLTYFTDDLEDLAQNEYPVVEAEQTITTAEADQMYRELQDYIRRTSNHWFTNASQLEGDFETLGNVYISSDLDLHGHTMIVGGDFYHHQGNLTFNQGSVIIGGDYRAQKFETNSAGETYLVNGHSRLIMDYEEDLIRVGGNMYHWSAWSTTMTNGRIELMGDMEQATPGSFLSSQDHTLAILGEGPHTIRFDDTGSGNSSIANLEIAPEAVTTWSGFMRVGTLRTDAEITEDHLTITALHLNGHTLKINGSPTIFGDTNLYLGQLYVTGDLLFSQGTMTFDKGSLVVNGDLRCQKISVNSVGESSYIHGHTTLKMAYDEDRIQVGGDFFYWSDWPASMAAGRVELYGGFDLDSSGNYVTSGSHTVSFLGQGPHRVYAGSGSSVISNLEMQDADNIVWSGYFNVTNLQSDFAVTSDGMNISAVNLNGHTLCVTGDLQISGNTNLYHGCLSVDGSVLHTGGTTTFNQGSLITTGDYRMQNISTNSAGEESYVNSHSALVMTYDEDLIRVGGDLYAWSNWGSNLTAGRMELLGGMDLTQRNYVSSNTHTVSIVGPGPHTMRFTADNTIANLELDADAEVTWSGYLNAAKLQTDGAITSSGLEISNLHLNGHTLDVTADAKIIGGVNLQLGSLSFSGDLMHTGGTVTYDKGSMYVGGDYLLTTTTTNSVGEISYAQGYGCSVMTYDEDTLTILGDYYINTGWYSTLTAGTLYLAGDLTRVNGEFRPSGTHTTVLNGTGDVQYITFGKTSEYFNILRLTREGVWYVFDPDNCWRTLYEVPTVGEVEVSNISLAARNKTLTMGSTWLLEAVVYPANATDPTLTWTSTDETVAAVDETGLVTAKGVGTAVIRATASNGLYRTCTVTVQEIFSGVLSVGTAKAAPGQLVAIPVTAWDNPGFAAMRVTAVYDPSLLTLTEVNPGDVLSQGRLTFEDADGSCRILWYHSEDIRADGVLFHLIFRVNDDAAMGKDASVSIQTVTGDITRADHTDVGFVAEPGAVEIRAVTPGDIYEDGAVDVHDILLLQQYLTLLQTLTERQLAAADLDGSGQVNMQDIVLLAQLLVGAEQTAAASVDAISDEVFTCWLSDADLSKDGYIDQRLAFQNCSGAAAFRFVLDYDTELLEIVDIYHYNGSAMNSLCTNLSDPDREQTVITWYSAENCDLDNYDLFILYRPKGDDLTYTVTELTFEPADICDENAQPVPLVTEHGTIGALPGLYLNLQNLARNGDTVTASVVNTVKIEGQQMLLVCACYDADGRLLGTRMQPEAIIHGSTVSIPCSHPDAAVVKLFALNPETMSPYGLSQTVP